MNHNFQRQWSISNAHVGHECEKMARDFFEEQNIHMSTNFSLTVGVGEKKRIIPLI